MSQFALFCVERECSTQRSQNSGQHGARPSCKSVSGPKPTPMCSVRTTPGTGVAPKLDLDFFAPTFLALSRCFRCHLQELLLNPPPPRSAPGAQWHKQAPRNMTWTRLPAGTAVLTHYTGTDREGEKERERDRQKQRNITAPMQPTQYPSFAQLASKAVDGSRNMRPRTHVLLVGGLFCMVARLQRDDLLICNRSTEMRQCQVPSSSITGTSGCPVSSYVIVMRM